MTGVTVGAWLSAYPAGVPADIDPSPIRRWWR
jgi:hypothetical protein